MAAAFLQYSLDNHRLGLVQRVKAKEYICVRPFGFQICIQGFRSPSVYEPLVTQGFFQQEAPEIAVDGFEAIPETKIIVDKGRLFGGGGPLLQFPYIGEVGKQFARINQIPVYFIKILDQGLSPLAKIVKAVGWVGRSLQVGLVKFKKQFGACRILQA